MSRKGSASGKFDIKSAYHLLEDNHSVHEDGKWEKLWKMRLEPKSKLFIYIGLFKCEISQTISHDHSRT